jgi:hypothetical protein
MVYGPPLNAVESDRALVPATTSSVVTVLLIVIVLLDPVSAVPVVQPVPAPLVTGVVPFSVKHMIVVPELELVHVTEMDELELPEVGVQLGAVAGLLVLMVNKPRTTPDDVPVPFRPAVASRVLVLDTATGPV